MKEGEQLHFSMPDDVLENVTWKIIHDSDNLVEEGFRLVFPRLTHNEIAVRTNGLSSLGGDIELGLAAGMGIVKTALNYMKFWDFNDYKLRWGEGDNRHDIAQNFGFELSRRLRLPNEILPSAIDRRLVSYLGFIANSMNIEGIVSWHVFKHSLYFGHDVLFKAHEDWKLGNTSADDIASEIESFLDSF